VPLTKQYELDVTSLTTSMNINAIAAGPMPFAGSVTAVRYVPNATQAGGIDVNHRMLRLFNRGAAGTGTTSMALLDLTSANANGTLTDNVASSFSLTTSTALLAFAAGDVLEYQSSMSATGMLDPGGRVVIDITRSVS
jgi:hypothetical protein